MCDYSQSKIYKIVSPSKNITYYGSTTHDLQKRLINHIRKYKYYKDGKTNYVSVNDVLECDDAVIELVEAYPCNNRKELDKKEGEYIKNNECINKNIPGRTHQEWKLENIEYQKEYSQEYYNNNKDKFKKYSKEYRTNNKDYYNEYRKTYYEDNKEKIKQYHKERYRVNVKEKKEENRNANEIYILEIEKEINNDHKQYMRNYMKKYYQKHKDKISSYYREKYRRQTSIASKIEKPVIEIVKSNIVKL
jgi:hypothetical protein